MFQGVQNIFSKKSSSASNSENMSTNNEQSRSNSQNREGSNNSSQQNSDNDEPISRPSNTAQPVSNIPVPTNVTRVNQVNENNIVPSTSRDDSNDSRRQNRNQSNRRNGNNPGDDGPGNNDPPNNNNRNHDPNENRIIPYFNRNRLDNSSIMRIFMIGTPVTDLIMRYGDYYSTGDIANMGSYIFYSEIVLAYRRQDRYKEAHFIADAFLPFMPDEMYLRRDLANKILKEYGLVPFRSGVLTDQARTEAWARVRELDTTLPTEPPASIDEAIGSNYARPNLTAGIYEVFLNNYRSNLNAPNLRRDRSKINGILASTIITIAKRANFTEDWLERTTTHLSEELGIEIRLLDTENMKRIFTLAEKCLTNIERVIELFRRLQSYFAPDEMSLRIRLILQRAEYAGIGSYRIIREAMKVFRGFRWDLVAKEQPTDWSNYTESYRIMRDNSFFGFLPASSEKPWNVKKLVNLTSFSAFFLHTKGGGEYNQIIKYQAYVKKFKSHTTLKAFINAYSPEPQDADLAYREEVLPDYVLQLYNHIVENCRSEGRQIPADSVVKTHPGIRSALARMGINVDEPLIIPQIN